MPDERREDPPLWEGLGEAVDRVHVADLHSRYPELTPLVQAVLGDLPTLSRVVDKQERCSVQVVVAAMRLDLCKHRSRSTPPPHLPRCAEEAGASRLEPVLAAGVRRFRPSLELRDVGTAQAMQLAVAVDVAREHQRDRNRP